MRFSLLECITIGSLSVTTIFGVAASICVTPGFIEKADLGNKVMSSVFTSEQMEAIQKRTSLEKIVTPPCYPIIPGGCVKPTLSYEQTSDHGREPIVDIDKMHHDVNAIFSTMEKGCRESSNPLLPAR